jgi:hypothetical protein
MDEGRRKADRAASLNFASWNLISGWLARLDGLRRAA